MRRGHAEALLPMVERTMKAAELGYSTIDRIAVTAGPGTFTGSRVGMSAALGLSFAHGLPVVTYSSLQCVARAAIEALGDKAFEYEGVLVARDAKRGSVFIEVTDMTGSEMSAPALLGIAEARHLATGHRFFALGSGVPILNADGGASRLELDDVWPDETPPPGITEPDARHMMQDAAKLQPTTSPSPLYLRPPDAMPSSRPPLTRQATGRPPNA